MGNQFIQYISFTSRGHELAEKLCTETGGTVDDGRGEGFSLSEWTQEAFARKKAIVFIGAAGICVRAVSPYLQSKAEDPAVICIDEAGRFVIPMLSGHLGGANALARELALLCSGMPVITTATDINHCFAVDLWAKKQNLALVNPQGIKAVSAKILAGESVSVSCPWKISGELPECVSLSENGDVEVTFHQTGREALTLIPRTAVLGIGCRRGISQNDIEESFRCFCEERKLYPQSICSAATIDRKAGEPALLAFCKMHGWPLRSGTEEQLAALPGDYTASAFVKETIGVDNVCERAAVLISGGKRIEPKYARSGVTFALASPQPVLDWRW